MYSPFIWTEKDNGRWNHQGYPSLHAREKESVYTRHLYTEENKKTELWTLKSLRITPLYMSETENHYIIAFYINTGTEIAFWLLKSAKIFFSIKLETKHLSNRPLYKQKMTKRQHCTLRELQGPHFPGLRDKIPSSHCCRVLCICRTSASQLLSLWSLR